MNATRLELFFFHKNEVSEVNVSQDLVDQMTNKKKNLGACYLPILATLIKLNNYLKNYEIPNFTISNHNASFIIC